MTIAATPSIARAPQTRTRQTKTKIISYLAEHGASTVSDIAQGVPACRDTIKARLAELEESGTVRGDIPPGERGGTTPYYSLTHAGTPSDAPKLVITVYITHAADGQLTVAFDNYPRLIATAGRFIDIPEVARKAAAGYTNQHQDNFTVHIRF